MRKRIFILLLILPVIYCNAQNASSRDTSTVKTKSLLMEEAENMASTSADQQKPEEIVHEDAKAAKEAKDERFRKRLFANYGSIALILIIVYLLRKKKGTPVR